MGELDTLTTAPAIDMRLVSEAHAKRVEQLRDAQIRLAEAWAGSESRLGTNQSSLLARLANSAAGYYRSLGEVDIIELRKQKYRTRIVRG